MVLILLVLKSRGLNRDAKPLSANWIAYPNIALTLICWMHSSRSIEYSCA